MSTFLFLDILAAPNYQTHTHTDSNVNVNETSDITILPADVAQAEQTPNLQRKINTASSPTGRPVCVLVLFIT